MKEKIQTICNNVIMSCPSLFQDFQKKSGIIYVYIYIYVLRPNQKEIKKEKKAYKSGGARLFVTMITYPLRFGFQLITIFILWRSQVTFVTERQGFLSYDFKNLHTIFILGYYFKLLIILGQYC